MKRITETTFKAMLKTLLSELLKNNVVVKHQNGLELLSKTLSTKPWTSFKHSLPISLSNPGNEEVKRMEIWLNEKNKPLDSSTCKTLLQYSFKKTTSEWFCDDDLVKMKNEVAPLFTHYEINGAPNTAVILINPEHHIFYTASCESLGDPSQVYGYIYSLPVSGNASGKAIVETLKSQEFLSLLESISKNWTLDWDGNNYFGDLNEAHIKLTEFTENHLIDLDFADIYEGRQFLDPVEGFDSDGNEIQDNEETTIERDAVKLLLAEEYVMTPTSNLKLLEQKIRNDLGIDTEVIGLTEILNEYHEMITKNASLNT